MDLLLHLVIAYGIVVGIVFVISIGCFAWFLWEIGKGSIEHWCVRHRRNGFRVL